MMLSDNVQHNEDPEMLSGDIRDCAMIDYDEDPGMLSDNILDCAKDALINVIGGSHINAGMLLRCSSTPFWTMRIQRCSPITM